MSEPTIDVDATTAVAAPDPRDERTQLPEGVKERVVLPSGNTVDLRDPVTLVARDRKKVLAQIDEGRTLGTVAIDIADGILAMLILGWSFPLALPSIDITSLDKLGLMDESVLQKHPLVEEVRTLVFPEAKDNPSEVHADPNLRTGRFTG